MVAVFAIVHDEYDISTFTINFYKKISEESGKAIISYDIKTLNYKVSVSWYLRIPCLSHLYAIIKM